MGQTKVHGFWYNTVCNCVVLHTNFLTILLEINYCKLSPIQLHYLNYLHLVIPNRAITTLIRRQQLKHSEDNFLCQEHFFLIFFIFNLSSSAFILCLRIISSKLFLIFKFSSSNLFAFSSAFFFSSTAAVPL
jgi:hypothetical protein